MSDERDKGGRPPFEIDDAMLSRIESLAGYGISISKIAHIIGCSPATLYEKKKADPRVSGAIEAGKAKAEGLVGQRLFQKALTGDMAAIRWWETTRAGRSEKVKVEHSKELSSLSDDELARIARGEEVHETPDDDK